MIEFKKYLPIGSVVLLKNANKRLMIYGRLQKAEDSDSVRDYIGCLYPEGNISTKQTYMFDHDQIERVYFVGFQDPEEFEFVDKYREYPYNYSYLRSAGGIDIWKMKRFPRILLNRL